MNLLNITKLFLAFSLLVSFFTQFHSDSETDSNSDSELSYSIDNSITASAQDGHRPVSSNTTNPVTDGCHTCHVGHIGCVFQAPLLFLFISKDDREGIKYSRTSSKYINPYLKLIERPPIHIA